MAITCMALLFNVIVFRSKKLFLVGDQSFKFGNAMAVPKHR